MRRNQYRNHLISNAFNRWVYRSSTLFKSNRESNGPLQPQNHKRTSSNPDINDIKPWWKPRVITKLTKVDIDKSITHKSRPG